jgi:hypothetical protein
MRSANHCIFASPDMETASKAQQRASDEDIMSNTTQRATAPDTTTYNTNHPATTAPTSTLAAAFIGWNLPTPAPNCA